MKISLLFLNGLPTIKVKTGLTFINLNLGVGQGDNLSPKLFKIFINDLQKYVDRTSRAIPSSKAS